MHAAVEEKPQGFEKNMIENNKLVAKWLDFVAEKIDIFLAGTKLTTKKNNTTILIDNSTYVNQGRDTANSTSINLNLHLPNVEEYWQLKFTSYDETQEKSELQKATVNSPRQKNYGASVGLVKKLGRIRANFQPRLALQSPLKISHSLRFEIEAEYDKYKVTPKLEFFANPDDGTGVFFALSPTYTINPIYSLTYINEGEYKDKLHILTVANGISLGKSVSPRASLGYAFVVYSVNQPSYHMDGYSVLYSWNYTIYKKILDYKLTPHLDFAKESSYTGNPGVTFSVGLKF